MSLLPLIASGIRVKLRKGWSFGRGARGGSSIVMAMLEVAKTVSMYSKTCILRRSDNIHKLSIIYDLHIDKVVERKKKKKALVNKTDAGVGAPRYRILACVHHTFKYNICVYRPI
jgi:hypothetical protein